MKFLAHTFPGNGRTKSARCVAKISPYSSGASGGSLHGGASFKGEKAHLAA